MNDTAFAICHAVLPECGEDHFVLHANNACVLMGVSDGCGGLGSRRYPALDGHTGAYAASRLATHVLTNWAGEQSVPCTQETAQALALSLSDELSRVFRAVADEKCTTGGIRITGSMQRRLPATLCAAMADERRTCFFWAGDSRAWVLNGTGLHQCTRDHLKGEPDAFESLYRDTPLSSLVCADLPVKLCVKQLPLSAPCMLILATDGAYNALPTPMEFEFLLLNTLKDAKTPEAWQRKLTRAIDQIAQDDATLVVHITGNFDELKSKLLVRRELLQKQFITPVRRKKGDVSFARKRWEEYRASYDWTEEVQHG